MQKSKLLVAALGALFAMPVMADDSPNSFSGNVSLVSDYIFRGISQTNNKPAIQGGFDYSHSSGFYAGVWGSSISWIEDATYFTPSPGQINSSVELDTYLGFKGSTTGDVSYDVGYLRYNYPGTYPGGFTSPDTDEIYGSVGYSIVTAKISYSLGDLFGVADARGSTYVDLSASYPIPDTSFTVSAHAGRQTYRGSTADALNAAGTTATYTDYKVGVSTDFSGFSLGLMYTKTNADSGGFYTNAFGRDLGKGTVSVSLSRAL